MKNYITKANPYNINDNVKKLFILIIFLTWILPVLLFSQEIKSTEIACPELLELNDDLFGIETYQALVIESDATIHPNSTINFQAEEIIRLRNGFYANSAEHTKFTAYLVEGMCELEYISKNFTNIETESPEENFSFSVFPNPAVELTIFTFTLPASQLINFKVYDIHGRLLETVVNNISYDAGTYEIIYDAGHLLPGIYYCNLNGNTIKLIISE